MELRLTDAVRTLREDLTKAVEEAEAHSPDITFKVGPIQMDFEVQFRADAKAKAGFSAWIATGSAEAGAGRTKTHKVAFTLTPHNATHPGGDVSINSTRQDTGGDTTPVAFTR
ncbi:trypco2 family protein [Nocardiopsis sp. LDBS0036]|uniref:trypco2 family protein n=1 Tax=Nocardiopsis sp. LDBS0036 TaxID=3104276 RepID=UPI00102AFEBB